MIKISLHYASELRQKLQLAFVGAITARFLVTCPEKLRFGTNFLRPMLATRGARFLITSSIRSLRLEERHQMDRDR